ncbi:serine threonine- kinase tel1 [Fusarium albosuccineum]|uniref:Serine/threonine-protein kinase Tel1 n=1 Tax=Fusarium albosuccineum TaxID=1237068 RepID=A0A8H4L708_9HYPO|nr:serine threonine- kinase tel1 [Fusarium albosuccineum]
MASHRSNVMSLARDVKSASLRDREKAVDELSHLLNPRNRSANLSDLGDKSYHEIFEAIFSFVLREKPNFYDKKKSQTTSNSAASRLSKCAAAVRMAAGRSVSKLGRKTLLAIVDHITQVLPGPNDDFVPPLLQDYVKALTEVLSRPAHVELLARKKGEAWELCVDFFLDVALFMLPDEGDASALTLARASPAPGSGYTRSTGRSTPSTQSQRRTAPGEGGPLKDVLEGLYHLVMGGNAPLLRRLKDITQVVIRVLSMKQLSLGSLQTLAFAIINALFSATQTDDLAHSISMVQSLLPLMSYWWRSEKVSQDEVIRALRIEISRSLFLAHLHIEHLVANSTDDNIRQDLEDLIENLWTEYSKRGEAFRLQLSDITFSPSSLPAYSLQLDIFGLRPHNVYGEGHWAVVQNLAFLERIMVLSRDKRQESAPEHDEQRRKRRRIRQDMSRIRLKLKATEVAVQRTALQLVPFLLASNSLGRDELLDLLPDLVALASDKNPVTASWALVASASCIFYCESCHDQTDVWRQLWHLAARSISLPGTSRAACVLLHAILEADVLPYHTISQDINSIVTTADVSGPSVLCDASISLMFHVLHLRHARIPSASQSTCHHIIRWVFLRWNPNESTFASYHSLHIHPIEFVNLLRACCGTPELKMGFQTAASGGPLSETWNSLREIEPFSRYILLLEDDPKKPTTSGRCNLLQATNSPPLADANTRYASQKLTLELFYPKLGELTELCASWTKRMSEGGIQISFDRFQSLLSACLIGTMLLPQIGDLNSTQSSSVEPTLMEILEKGLEAALTSVEPTAFVDSTLRAVRPVMPDLNTASLNQIQSSNAGLLRLLAKIWTVIEDRRTQQSSGNNVDLMDIDGDFDSQSSRASSILTPAAIPRFNTQLRMDTQAFYTETKARLRFLFIISEDAGQIGLVPDGYVEHLINMHDDELLLCQNLLFDIFRSDLIVTPDNALGIIERLGEYVGQMDYQCAEVALSTCIGVIDGLHPIWLNDKRYLSERVGDLYYHFVKVCLTSNILSPRAQISMVRLLFTLLRANSDYGKDQDLDSSRTCLLYILKNGPMSVKYAISEKIADVFDLFILKLHDEVFVDVLDSLPTDPTDTTGIAFRLLVLANLACRWSTLLRRCTYHIFETPGKIPSSTHYATRCLVNVSRTLQLESPKVLFRLFSRQLLYTWLECDPIKDIPFSIFGFATLGDLLKSAQAEAIGLTVMRGQDEASTEVARLLGGSQNDLIRDNFTTAVAYSMIFGDSNGGDDKERGETYVKKMLGRKAYVEAIYINFVDIAALFFDLIDQENSLEKVFARFKLDYAGEIMSAMKAIAHSPAELPANQQPMFKAKYLINELYRLCQNTEFQFHELWTPPVVVSIARKLLNTVHSALGPLHACSVLRKVRILISLAGAVALESYPLEMLLNATRKFIVDSECADDALGISQYLLAEGSKHLTTTPSFLAGYALSTLASLRVFLESSQSSTTQESQFKATMGKAEKFHGWFSKYLEDYDSPMFKSLEQRKAFKSITQSAARIRSSGNAERGTAESKLLLDILDDGGSEYQLLNDSSRQLALGLLCGDFSIPISSRDDIIESDSDALKHATAVWKSCDTQDLSDEYLSWAGRVIGRSFSASGSIPADILRESYLDRYQKIAPGSNGSEMGILYLLQDLTANPDSMTAGLAEAALRSTVSEAALQEDEPLVIACQRSLSESLLLTSQWGAYRSPPSDKGTGTPASSMDEQAVWLEDISSKNWLLKLSAHLAQSVPDSIILSVLSPILARVEHFAESAFPFVIHLVLYFQMNQQQTLKRHLSTAMRDWLQCTAPAAKDNLKLLINTLLYLRTQEYPKESSIADRSHWLDVDYALASASASRCGMHKTALLLAELVSSETSRASRRSSAAKEADMSETLLTVFENIDDPDAYYGLPEEASLSNVLARVEYENDGPKSLAFRGAQYDSNIRLGNPVSQSDGQALVKALSTLGLSGLSNSLLQTQESLESSPASLESTFSTARKLEIWNLPAPVSNHHAVTVYKAYQSIHQATDISAVRTAVHDGFSRTMSSLTAHGLNATALRKRLGALASLTELDDVLGVSDTSEMENILGKFKSRSDWMRSGLYDSVSQILSCRGTTMSMVSQQNALRSNIKLSVAAARQMEVESMITASEVYRYHQATQESLNISMCLTNLISPCTSLDLYVDAAINIEAANSLWDYGEMSTSIRMLQSIDRDSSLKKQTISVSRSDLLSKIGYQVSVARLEKPHDIQKKYLEPALKELKGKGQGREAGLVFHQFAMFCDQQLQDPDGLEDLTRLQNLRKAKSDEVSELKSLISSTRDSQLKTRYSHVLNKEKQWLDLDEQELRRVEQTRSEFVRLSLENYLLSLIASDEHNNDALRFTALWLERSEEEMTNKAVMRYLSEVPTRKFASLTNQLTSRLQDHDTTFQKLLLELVYKICVDHPYHGMYQIWSGTKAKAQQKDEVAVLRVRATDRVAKRLAETQSVSSIWLSIDKTSKYYHALAMDRNPNKYKSGAKIALRDSTPGHNLVNCLAKYRIPSPTMHIELSATKDYSKVPIISKLEPTMTIASGVSAPKIITALGSDGVRYKQLVKGGHDDLRQDAIMEQVFSAVSSLLKLHRTTQQRNLGIRTYKVLPLTASSGLIEFVPNTIPLHEFLMPAHERYYPRDLKGSQCRKEIFGVQSRTVETRISTYRKVTDRFHPVMRYFFMEHFMDPDEWFVKRLAYTRSTAAISMLGHVLGLGDRHGHNILLDHKTGEVVHIDLGVAFEAGRILPVPELVPFRLTRDIVDGMGITKTEGVFRRCCEFTLDALREEQYSIMTILDVLRYDPLYTWSISPLRLAKLQKARHNDDGVMDDEQSEAETKKGKKAVGHVNEPSEADRALEIVRKKLSKTLSVTATVNDLINQATDERNLAVLYSDYGSSSSILSSQTSSTVHPLKQSRLPPPRLRRSMQPVAAESTSPSRRRPRLDSSSSPSSPTAASKRARFEAVAMTSAKARGKLPETIDLTQQPSAFKPYTGAKKLVIKNLRAPTSRDAQVTEYYARTEKELEGALEAVFAGRTPDVPLERLYRGVEDVCRKGDPGKVYRMLKERIETHLQRNVLPRIQRNGGTSDLDALRSVLAEWKTWNTQAILIRSTFSFLDRTHLLRESLPSINDMTISQFRRMAFPSQEAVFKTSPGNKTVAGMCALIEFDRRGDDRMDSALLKDAIMMLYVLGVYVKHFEPVFLNHSESYFKDFGETWGASSLKDYIRVSENLLKKEAHRCIEFNLDSTTEKQLMDSAHLHLIDNYSDKLLNSGNLAKLLSDREVKSMKALYDLLRLSGIQKKMKTPWGDYIRTTGAAIISDKARGDEMVLRLLEHRRSLDLMIRDAFGKDEDFLWGMREAFGKFMNDRKVASCWDTGTSKIGEMTAKYIDMLLRGGLKSLPKELLSDIKDRATAEKEGQASTGDEDAELDRQLDQALELFRFIEGKDAFEAFYKKDLARRLLMGRSASQDAERNMLTKLRGECGSNFTHNLEQMFKDQELAKDEMESYKQWCQGSLERKAPLDLQVMILSAAAWPTYPDVRLNLPDEVATQIERFDQYYKNKHTGRVLTWKHSLAHCAIKATFAKGTKELLVSAYQAVVLMLFNTVPADGFLAYEQIATGTGLQGGDLDRTLQSLACGKARVLTKHPKGRDVKPTDTFTFNKTFTDPKYRVKINQIQLKETKEENKATHERIAQDRRFETQAAIVRIMKSRKTMGHAELVAEVINLTKKRGSVEPAAIKKEIESLIEKDYIEREGNSYVYLA